MKASIQQTLCELFNQVIDSPDTLSTTLSNVPVEEWAEESEERQLLTDFRTMLTTLQQSYQHALRERQEIEEQLRESESQYRSIFEETMDGLNINKLDGSFVEVNPALCKMFGYSREELMNIDPTTLIHTDYQHSIEESLQTIKAGNLFEARSICVRKDGSSFPIEAHVSPFTYKGQPHLLSVTRDITEQVRMEQQLREKEEQYRSIFEATSDGLIIRDLDGFAVEANPAVCKMHGYTYEEFIGLPRSAIVHPQSHAAVAAYIEAVREGQTFLGQAIEVRKDGSTFPAEVRGSTFIYLGQPHMLTVLRDITERVEAEKQLREKEEQYRSIFEAASDGLVIGDLEDGNVVEANPAACQMYGYPYEEFIGMSAATLTHPDYHHLIAEGIQTIREGGNVHTLAVSMRKDGTPFPNEVHTTAFTIKGKPHFLASIHDITERVEAEKQLREKEEQYRNIFEASSDGLIIRNMDGVVVQVNPAACKMHGYTYEEYINLSRNALIHPDYHLQLKEIIQTVNAGRTFQGQAVDLRKDGSTFPVEFRSDTFTYLGQPHMLTVLHDITERVQAEQQLREREEQYRGVFEATYDGIAILDLDGFLVEANPAFCRTFGYTYEELMGLHASVLTAPNSLPSLNKALDTLKAGRGYHVRELEDSQALRKDGTWFYAESQATTFTYRGKPHSLIVVRDITEQIQAQQLLEKRVEERTHELSTLLEVSHNVASTLELKPLLNLILEQLKSVVHYDGAAIATRQGDEFIFLDYQGPLTPEQAMQLRLLFSRSAGHLQVLHSGEPVIIPDAHDTSPLARSLQELSQEHLAAAFVDVHTWMGIPLKLKDQVIGMMTLSAHQPNYYTPQHAKLALAIANQAAVAIENARLYEQAHELAALEERQHLARELHDSVSQALYGIALGAHTARKLLNSAPERLAEPLDYVLSLTEAALVEMRALIFELRPESLETEGLVVALSKQASALQTRYDLIVSATLCDEPNLSLKVKQDLYRVAQEALHNTVKHAHASNVDLRLNWIPEGLLMEIQDNGKGFDTEGAFPGHLGLHSMRERIIGLNGTFQIESAPGQGTRIRVLVPGQNTL